MNRRMAFPIWLSVLGVIVWLLTACGQPRQEMPVPVYTAEPAATSEPFTEEELRRAIHELGEDEASQVRRQEYYERLLAMDVFGEEDYEELAGIYGSRGDWQEQRRMLSKLLRLYPSVEHAQQLSAVTVYRDDMQEDMASLAGQIKELLEQQDAVALKGLIGTEQWRLLLQGNMDMIETRTCYRAGDEIMQIAAGGLNTEIAWRDAEGHFLFYREDNGKVVLGSATLQDGVYEGDVKAAFCDTEGNVSRTVWGTLHNGVCVGQMTVVYQGMEFTGAFQEDGTIAEEQLKEVTEQGGVIYAYGPGKRDYLYQENVALEEFRLDATYFGLPEYEEWR
ncbi:MAG: hypothetical protein NC543_13275 [bacterium]|nr:hypothetical protein [bacterium]MCM1375655.1 hypothetical protein [Muribaculum sp.]